MKRIVISRGDDSPRPLRGRKNTNSRSNVDPNENAANGGRPLTNEPYNVISTRLVEPIPFFKRLKEIEQSEQLPTDDSITDLIRPMSKFPTVPPLLYNPQVTSKIQSIDKLPHATTKREVLLSSVQCNDDPNTFSEFSGDKYNKQNKNTNIMSQNLEQGQFSQLQLQTNGIECSYSSEIEVNPFSVIRDEFISSIDELKEFEDRKNWIRILLIQAKKRSSSFEALTYLEETLDRCFKNREPKSVDLIVLPGNWWPEPVKDWDILDPISSVPWIQKLSSIVAKHQVYCVPGSFYEIQKDLECENVYRKYESTMLLNRKGDFVGMYKKRKKSLPSLSAGDNCAIFDTDFGRVALLINCDLEDINLLKENLAFTPDLIVNPIFIQSKTGIGEDHSRSWKTAMAVIGTKVENVCLESKVSVVRCDQPFSSKFGVCASGTSQLIGPFRSIIGNTYGESCFLAQVSRKQKEDVSRWQACTKRHLVQISESKMNNHIRYRFTPYKRHVSRGLEDAQVTSICKIENHVISASANGSLHFHNFESHQPIKIIKEAHNGPILSMAVVGNRIWTCSKDRRVCEWNLNGECVHVEQSPMQGLYITYIAGHPNDPNTMWLGDSAGCVRFYDKRAGSILGCRTLSEAREGATPVNTLRAFKDSICCSNENSPIIRIWDVHSGFSKVPVSFACSSNVRTLSNIHSDFIVIGTTNRIETWSLTKGVQLLKYNVPVNLQVSAVEILSDSHAITSFIPTTDEINTLHAELNLFDFQNYRSGGKENVFLHDFSEASLLFTATALATDKRNCILVGDKFGRVSSLEFEGNIDQRDFGKIFL